MKSMLKSELAREAGVSVRTLINWCKPHQKELVQMGYKPYMKMLPPKIVEYLVEQFCINFEKSPMKKVQNPNYR